ncbi:MAG: RHS repeat-associated core domain-containing protein [Paludibacteraceae bacterium]|nr:RHS repeat-associated core domain-containing protein [Paludibacteraceae bacterium]
MCQIKYIRYIFLLLLLLSSVGATATADRVVVTSGRVEYDAFGRAVAVFYPTVDNAPVESFSVAIDTVAPTETEYDVLDRPVKVRYPDATEKDISYRVVGHTVVTAVSDAWRHVTESHVNGSGQTVRSVQVRENGDRLTTSFGYDGIGRLVSVRDAEGNVTTSVYDMADRRLRVTHPASGETVFTYDALGNVLTRRTASGDTISYLYELGRLKDVLYPKHPEYNVHYHYGGPRHPNNAGGRVRFREDATGGIEYSYDQMGNVSETLRTVVVPNDSVGAGTFRTSFKYDAFGKLLSMTYPDGEVVCYLYDRSGQLVSVYIYDYAANDRYVAAIGYDKFGDRVYMEYGNGTATRYAYDIMRRLDTVYVSMPGGSWLNRTYTYDVVGNITSQDNTGSDTGLLYTPVSHEYGYDDLYRLTSAKGNRDNTENGYTLTMTYDKMYRVKTKNQRLWQTGVQFEGTLRSGYNLSYNYSSAPGRRFQMSTVSDLNYRCEGEQTASDNVYEKHKYRYDANGNIEHVNTARRKADKDYWDLAHEECFRWDEENRLMAISQDGYVSNYWYDADGERVIKEHGNNQAVFVNSGQDSVSTDTRQFTIYPSAYLTVHNGNWYTNHIYIGSERIASHLGTMDPDEGLSFYSEEHSAGAGMDKMLYSVRCDTLVAVMASNYAHFGLPYNGKNRMVHTPRPDLAPSEPGGAEGGMRFYWMMGGAVEGADGNGGPGRSAKSDHGLNQAPKYFYHSDHLGSSSLVTNTSGIVIQQMDYLPYGEVFLEMRADANHSTPYKFNGKELDEETGLYYYGARYMNPRLSIWYATDPSELAFPNISTYCYVLGNPIELKDDNGEIPIAPIVAWVGKRAFAGALIDVGGQLLGEWLINGGSLSDAWNRLDINWVQVSSSAGENVVKGKYTRIAMNAASDMVSYMLSDDNWTWENAFQRAGYGAISAMVGERLAGIFVRKFGDATISSAQVFKSIQSRTLAESYAIATKYKGYKNANIEIRNNNPVFDLFDNSGNIVDVTTTNAKKIMSVRSNFQNKIKRLSEIQGYNNRTLQIYVPYGQYYVQEIKQLEQNLVNYIRKGKYNVSVSIDTIK